MKSRTPMELLTHAIAASGVWFNPVADLPRPNIYMCSVYPFDHQQRATHLHICADHTGLGLEKVVQVIKDEQGWQPSRMNCQIRLRRMLLGDLIDCPQAYDSALKRAMADNDGATVRSLLGMLAWLSQTTGVSLEGAAKQEAADGYEEIMAKVFRQVVAAA